MRHELVQLTERIDWDWLDHKIAPLYSDKGRPGIETRFVLGLFLLKHIHGLLYEQVRAGWRTRSSALHREEFIQHAFPHERSD
jgi:IS5 family transposase